MSGTPAEPRPWPDCTPDVRHFFPLNADHCTCRALRRPPVDVVEATLFTPARTAVPEIDVAALRKSKGFFHCDKCMEQVIAFLTATAPQEPE